MSKKSNDDISQQQPECSGVTMHWQQDKWRFYGFLRSMNEWAQLFAPVFWFFFCYQIFSVGLKRNLIMLKGCLSCKEKWALSVTWPVLSPGRLVLHSPTYLEPTERMSHSRQHISSQSRPHKGRKGKHRRRRLILVNICRLFFFFFSPPFILLLTACLILIKPILHSRRFDFHWIDWR